MSEPSNKNNQELLRELVEEVGPWLEALTAWMHYQPPEEEKVLGAGAASFTGWAAGAGYKLIAPHERLADE